MSYLNARNALIQNLLNSSITGITNDDIAYDDRHFNPDGKANWLSAYFRPVTSNPTSKDTDSSEDTGYLQININSKSGGYDVDTLAIMDDVQGAFKANSTVTYQNQEVHILSINSNDVGLNGGWWRRVLTINYSTFSAR